MINANHRYAVASECLALRSLLRPPLPSPIPFLEGTPVFKMSQPRLFCSLGNYILPCLKCSEEPLLHTEVFKCPPKSPLPVHLTLVFSLCSRKAPKTLVTDTTLSRQVELIKLRLIGGAMPSTSLAEGKASQSRISFPVPLGVSFHFCSVALLAQLLGL